MAASLFFAADDKLRLYWVSGARSRHSRNLGALVKAAVTVHAAAWSWTEIRGVQLEGSALPLTRLEEREAAWKLYLDKFAFAREFEAEVSRSTFYRFTPRWARLIDNRVSFGHREEIQF